MKRRRIKKKIIVGFFAFLIVALVSALVIFLPNRLHDTITIEAGEIGYAVLDVFEEEPLSANNPLWSYSNVIVSPHVSSHSSRYVERSLAIFKPSLTKWLDGDTALENVMDLSRGY